MTLSHLLASLTPARNQSRQEKPWFVRILEDPTAFLRDLLEHALPAVELVALAATVLGALYLATRLVRLRARHRLARQGTRFEIALPEEPDRALEQSLRGSGIERLPWVELAPLSGGHASSCSLVAADTPALPLETHHASAPSRMVLAALAGQSADEGAVVQLVLRPAPTAMRRRSLARARKLRRGGPRSLWPAPVRFGAEVAAESLDIFVPGAPARPGSAPSPAAPPDPWAVERAKLIEEKSAEPFLAAWLRLAAFAGERSRARTRRDFLAASFAPFHGRVGLRHRREPYFWRRLHAWLPGLRTRLLLTPSEAAALLPIPERTADAPLSLAEPPARRIAAVSEAPRTGIVVGRTDREGFSEELLVAPEALLQHVHVLGPTGRGKSTWLLNLTLAWIQAGYGFVLLDPKRDLVQRLLRRIPESRIDDVELLDLGDETHPPALNLLACRRQEADVHVEALAGIFRRLFTRFWGPRSEDILRAALATLLTGGRAGAPAPTLADVLALLTDPAERGRYSVRDPVALAQFWRQWNEFSGGQREQALAPLSNKLRAFLSQHQLRNVLCQPEAPDFEQIVAEGRILVCSLPKGVLGSDAASLIGSVLTYRLWHAAMRLGPATSRPPFLCLIDEFHQFCHLPQGLAEALAEARGYRLGFVLAHQHLGQLVDRELLEAVDANCQTKICFSLPPGDAKRMARHFAPRLDEYDLEHLGPFQIACRIAHGGRQLPAATAKTLPLPERVAGDPEFAIRRRTRALARTREEVEALLAEQFGREDEPPAGRAEADDPSPPGSPPGPPPDGGRPRGSDPHRRGGHGDSDDPDDESRDAA